jgi:hypothetical protein
MTVFGLVMGGALGFLRSQSRGFSLGTDRMTVLQNLRFTAGTLEKDLRSVGSGVPDGQPFLIYAGSDAVAFNANFVSNVTSDPSAVYIDPDAPSGSVSALTKAERSTLPGTGLSYPDTSYLGLGGINSQAETITFWFSPDTGTTRNDDYILFRQVNFQAAEVVARNLLKTASLPFFEYYRLVTPINAPQRIEQVPASIMPLRHTVAVHLAPSDTSVAARIDSVRGVRVNFTATNGRSGTDERTRAISRLVHLPNAGLANRKTCGDEPLPVTGLVAGVVAVPTDGVRLTWNASIDETAGEKDVIRYAIWRRLVADPNWGDPYESIPAGLANYSWTDEVVSSGDTYLYAVSAQDCTPTLSQIATAGPILFP